MGHPEQVGGDVEAPALGPGGVGQEEGQVPTHVARHGSDRGTQVMRGAGGRQHHHRSSAVATSASAWSRSSSSSCRWCWWSSTPSCRTSGATCPGGASDRATCAGCSSRSAPSPLPPQHVEIVPLSQNPNLHTYI